MSRRFVSLIWGVALVFLTLPVHGVSPARSNSLPISGILLYQTNTLLLHTLAAGDTADNQHPVNFIDAGSLAQLLASLQIESSEAGTSVYLMTENRAIKAGAELATALGRLEQAQDVLMATYRDVGGLGNVRRLTTAARVFVEKDRLNLIFGQVDTFINEFRDPYPKVPEAGTRKASKLAGGRIKQADWFEFKPGRSDWVMFPINLAQSPRRSLRMDSAKQSPSPAQVAPSSRPEAVDTAPPAASSPAKARPSQWKDLEEGLETLERLRKKDLITDDEYRAKRRALLDNAGM